MTNETVANGAETSATLANDKRLADFNKLVRELGKASAEGRDALPSLAQAIVQNVANGVIDIEEKHPSILGDKKKNVSWAVHAYEMYMQAEGKKSVHDRPSDSITAQASKLNNMFKLGAMTTVDGAEVAQRASELYAELNGGPIHNKDYRSAYDFYLTVAKAQLNSDGNQNTTPLTDDQLKSLMLKPEPAPKELIGIIKGLMDSVEKLMQGKGKDKIQDTDELIEAAFNNLRDRHSALVQEAKIATLRAAAAAEGYSLI